MAARLPEIFDIGRTEADTEMATEGPNGQGSTWRTDDKEGRQDDEFLHYGQKYLTITYLLMLVIINLNPKNPVQCNPMLHQLHHHHLSNHSHLF